MSETSDAMRRELEQKSSEELISILRNRDKEERQPEAFEVVAAVLKERGVSPEEVTARGPEIIPVGDQQPLVTVARFFSPAEAQVGRMTLEEADIPAWVADESAGTMYGFGIGSRLQVRASDEATARQILAASPAPGDALPEDLAEPPCRKCGSRSVMPESRIDENEAERRWYYVCGDCGEAWPAS
jgi:hypothetical protein